MQTEQSVRVAMWSGPRNLSTAMMRSFENRSDCAVWDEPFYAAYLSKTGLDHPMREAVIAAGEADPARVAARCAGLGPAPSNARLFYQKHMTHHMLASFPLAWMSAVVNVFLIRAPERVAASYSAKREAATLRDIGFVEQKALFDRVCDRAGAPPIVVDAADLRRDPPEMLRALCAAIGIAFDPAMLVWPAGPRESDGVWAAHWYNAVWRSTRFAPPETDAPFLSDAAKRLAETARPYYDALRPFALSTRGAR